MNRKLAMGCVAAVAALSFGASGSTYAALSDFRNLNGNSAGATFLRLDLGKHGTGVAALSYTGLEPGSRDTRTIWLSSHRGDSPAANLSMTFSELADTAAPCDTAVSKGFAEKASGIDGCSIAADGATGTPAQGNISRVLSFASVYFPTVSSARECADIRTSGSYPSERSVILSGSRGNLRSADGTTYPVRSASGSALVLRAGEGACLAIRASWHATDAATGTPSDPVDAAAQGDSLSFQLRFDLTQV